MLSPSTTMDSTLPAVMSDAIREIGTVSLLSMMYSRTNEYPRLITRNTANAAASCIHNPGPPGGVGFLPFFARSSEFVISRDYTLLLFQWKNRMCFKNKRSRITRDPLTLPRVYRGNLSLFEMPRMTSTYGLVHPPVLVHWSACAHAPTSSLTEATEVPT